MILAQHAHHLLRLRGFGEGGEAAQVAEHHADVAAVAFESVSSPDVTQQLGDLRREEALEPADALDLADLLGTRCSSVLFQLGDLCRAAP